MQCLGNFLDSFLFLNFVSGNFVIAIRGLEARNLSSAFFGSVRTMLNATSHPFFLSLQTPFYDSEENENDASSPLRNALGIEALDAAVYEEYPNHLYTQVHNMCNPMPIRSTTPDSKTNGHIAFHPLENTPPIFNTSAQGNAPSTSSTFSNKILNKIARNISNNGKAPKNIRKARLTHFKVL